MEAESPLVGRLVTDPEEPREVSIRLIFLSTVSKVFLDLRRCCFLALDSVMTLMLVDRLVYRPGLSDTTLVTSSLSASPSELNKALRCDTCLPRDT